LLFFQAAGLKLNIKKRRSSSKLHTLQETKLTA